MKGARSMSCSAHHRPSRSPEHGEAKGAKRGARCARGVSVQPRDRGRDEDGRLDGNNTGGQSLRGDRAGMRVGLVNIRWSATV